MGLIVALDGGGTTTRAGLYAADGGLLGEAVGGPSNPAAQSIEAVVGVFAELCGALLKERPDPVDAVAAGIAGAALETVRRSLARELARFCRAKRALATDDLRPLLLANAGSSPAIVVVAGTGSSVLVQPREGGAVIVGGKGPLLSDEGSAFKVAERALRAASAASDGIGPRTALEGALLAEIGANDYVEAAHWAASASKRDVADLARVVSSAAASGDVVAVSCLEREAAAIAHTVGAAGRRFALDATAPVFLNGGLFEHCPIFMQAFTTTLETAMPGLHARLAPLRGHAAVAVLARMADDAVPDGVSLEKANTIATGVASTERRAVAVRHLDELTPLEIVRRMNQGDARCIEALFRAEGAMAKAVAEVGRALSEGGRLIYVGAGTSGRLGVLDASECPPTFGVSPGTVVGLVAGGDAALRNSCEDVEDDAARGAADLLALHPPVGPRDVTTGIAASGTTPYVLGALDAARKAGARTVMISCNPECSAEVDTLIVLDTGPEVLAGSTRLKAGTATKMALNMLSTGGMALAGYVHQGLMIGVQATNAKLRARAGRIAAELSGTSPEQARDALNKVDGRIPLAVLMLKNGWTPDEAAHRLRETKGNLRAALEGE